MPRIAKPKVELISSLPSDPVARKRLKGVVSEAVDIRMQIKDLQSQLKDIVSVEKETHQTDPKFLKTLITAEFDYKYQAEKKRKQLEDQVEQMNEADILMGRSNPNLSEDENEEESSEGMVEDEEQEVVLEALENHHE